MPLQSPCLDPRFPPFLTPIRIPLKNHLNSAAWFWASLVCLLVVMGICFEILQRRTLADQAPPHTVVALASVVPEATPKVDPESGPQPPPFPFVGPYLPTQLPPGSALARQAITDTLRRDDSIYLSLKKHRVSEGQIIQLIKALKTVFKSKKESKPGDFYTLATDTSGVIQYFTYTPHLVPYRPVVIELQDGALAAKRLDLPLKKEIVVIQARIEDNLSNAIQAIGESHKLIDLVADEIFGAVIELTKDTRQGDRIGLVFEKTYLHGRFIDYGRILLANYQGHRVSQLAVLYEDPEGHSAYYDSKGKSLARLFLLKPLPYRRISSGFNRRRFHPILKKPVPHLGTDYAAPSGTRVWATARGRVVHAGWKGGYGKLVEIEHPNGYRTRYAHLSRISVRKRQYVQQSDIIGRVGATGRATGPHLHYELIKNGQHRNPERVNKNTKGNTLQKGYRQAFAARRDHLLDLLEAGLNPESEWPPLAARGTE